MRIIDVFDRLGHGPAVTFALGCADRVVAGCDIDPVLGPQLRSYLADAHADALPSHWVVEALRYRHTDGYHAAHVLAETFELISTGADRYIAETTPVALIAKHAVLAGDTDERQWNDIAAIVGVADADRELWLGLVADWEGTASQLTAACSPLRTGT